ncbi:ribonucleoside-diphosphate reductase subunit alpha [Nocardiopsis prasina]|uniref:ribonucleoside-diphosphate reductase subunit alpha n=1 Tax=Nocardiopsis prasina TaxID=2015 RepID=UPI00034D26FA|nr:ribonucleoside-diphosphate reductase subunit alpha [Nocardiopsis prasina]
MTLDVEAVPASVRPAPTNGGGAPAAIDRIEHVVTEACARLTGVSAAKVLTEARRGFYPGIADSEVELALVMAARSYVEVDPNYSYVAARLLLDKLRTEALSFVSGAAETATQSDMDDRYASYLAAYVGRGIDLGQLDPALAQFDLERLGKALHADRDEQFTFLGLQTLYDRYFLHSDDVRYELPQAFFMRVAMGLALNEDDREARAIEFYELLSSFDFMASTPTLFNSGTVRAQLSSCFLTTVGDDLHDIFHGISNNAMLSKYSGGLGNDWTPVRGLGSHIKGTNGKSQGVVPFLKIANDTAVAVNQGGKRKGAVCAYLETWHIDIEEFLDLRKNTGDERRRTHDMNTANWVPDLFMKRVEEQGTWTLFSPDEVPDLHDKYGKDFVEAYEKYEADAEAGRIKVSKKMPAVDLWRRMLTMLFETGHPWITFKDPSNLRSPQQHNGVVHSSNLCTEITLNTSKDEVAVCNLGSVNLPQHVGPNGMDVERLRRTVRTAVRMLDNVIDVNFYTIPEARRANMRHRPVGLGLMGFQDALFKIRTPFASEGAVTFADESMELISYYAIEASMELAKERGSYESFDGSLWSKGVLPIDSLRLLADSRGGDLDMDRGETLDWDSLRERVKTTGMRNSNVMAIAPTATIANITGVSQSIEPVYRNLFVKSNMSGDFTVVNDYLVRDLKERGLWDEDMVSALKMHDGSLGDIDRVPDDLKALYATAFEVDPNWLVDAGSRRQKWIDQAQSLNLYMGAPSGRKLDALYRRAWRSGLKTTYYLRSQSATHVEKSTLKGTDGRLNAVASTPAAPAAAPAPSPVASPAPSPAPVAEPVAPEPEDEFEIVDGQACSIEDPECEACQ